MQIYILRNGEQYGPYSKEDIGQHLLEGSLLSDDLAWHEGRETWFPLSDLTASFKQNILPPPPPPRLKTTSGSSLYIAFGLGVVLAGIIAFFCIHAHISISSSPSSTNSTPAYYGFYYCTESDPGADRLVLKLSNQGFSFIGLQNPSDDPATAKEEKPDITITYLHVEDAAVQMDGTIREKLVATFTTIGQPAKPSDTTTTTTESEFSLQWYAGKNGQPDTVVFTKMDGRLQSIHFERKV